MKIEKDVPQNPPVVKNQRTKDPSANDETQQKNAALENGAPDRSPEGDKVEISGSGRASATAMSEDQAKSVAEKTAAAITQKPESASATHQPINPKRAEELLGDLG